MINDSKYVIFDFDGTIASSVEMALQIYNRVAPDYKCKQIDFKDIGMLSSEKPQKFFAEYGINRFKMILLLLRIRREIKKEIDNLKPVDGMLTVLDKIIEAGYLLGIVTSNSKRNVMNFLENNGLLNYFKFVRSGQNFFGKEKMFRDLLKKYNISPQNVVYVGDETRDIVASRKAGISVISVSWGLTPYNSLIKFKPDNIAENPNELPEIITEIFAR